MPDPSYTHVLVILDRSGSMAGCVDDTIGGFDSFVAEQQKRPGRCTLSLVQFDNDYQRPISFLSIQSVQSLRALGYAPRGSTALFDAIGRGMTEEGEYLSRMPESSRPGLVVVVVLTDGHENSSREWTKDRVQALIDQQTKQYAWSVQFLGASLDVAQQGDAIGVALANNAAYGSTRAAFSGVSRSTSRGRDAVLRGSSREEVFGAVAYSAEDRDLMSKTADEIAEEWSKLPPDGAPVVDPLTGSPPDGAPVVRSTSGA